MSESQYSENNSSTNPIKAIFINKEAELRSGWRIVVFLIIFAIVAQLIGGFIFVLGVFVPAFRHLLQAPADSVSSAWEEVLRFGILNLVSLLSVLIANAISAIWLERRSFASTGFQVHKGWVKDFTWGLALGAAALTIAVGIAAAAGATTFTLQNGDFATLAQSFAFFVIFFLIAAAFEEALIRGFVFQALEHNTGAVVAISITSLIFGILHLQNDDVTIFSTFNTILAGVWLGIAYLMTRSLWLATGLHFSWNFIMAYVFGLPVSGIKLFKTFAWLDGASTRKWISGTDYGPEGGVAATIALLICTLVIWKSGLFQTSAEMAQAIKHGKRTDDLPGITAQPVDEHPQSN
jgi:membrane protease YdiL (CAAX protease family)